MPTNDAVVEDVSDDFAPNVLVVVVGFCLALLVAGCMLFARRFCKRKRFGHIIPVRMRSATMLFGSVTPSDSR